MLAPRHSFARPLAIGLLAVSICLAGAWGCHGPDTFLRNDGSGGRPVGGFTGQLGGSGLGGSGGVPDGQGGSGLGGSGLGGSGLGGGVGTGGRLGGGAGGSVDGGMAAGGRLGTGGGTDAGPMDAPGVGGMMGTGGAPGIDGGVDVPITGTNPCAPFCAPSTTVVTFTVGAGYHTPNPVSLGEACFETITNVNGANCSNFTGRTLTVNGLAEPNCVTNFSPPARVNGGYCFQFSAGTPAFAQIAVF